MKRFHLKRLIPSLVVPTMIAAVAFAPLPGLPSAAHAAFDAAPTLQIVSPAKLDLATFGGSTTGIDVTFNYNCAGPSAGTPGTGSLNITSAVQSATQTNNGVGDTASSSTSGGPIALTCDGTTRQITAPLSGLGTFNVGQVTVTAALTDAATTPATITVTTTIRVL